MRRSVGIVVFIALATFPGSMAAQAAAPDAASRIEELLHSAHARGVFHGNALVAMEGDIVYEGSFGTADAAGTEALTPDHRFLIGSVGKAFSAVALVMLAEAGALSLHDPVSHHIVGLPAWAGRVRVRNLLDFSSGLPPVRYSHVFSDEDVLADLRAVRSLEFDPGAAYGYTNNDVFLRMRIVEAASGLPFDEFVRTRIFARCGMTGSTLDPAADAARFANSFDDARAPDLRRSPMTGHPAVTARDLFRWARCLHDGTLISRESLVRLAQPVRDGAQAAIGVAGVEDGVIRWHAHTGQVASYETLQYVDRGAGVTIILLSNSKQQQVGSMAAAVEQALRGEPYETPKKDIEIALRARIARDGFAAGMALLGEIDTDAGATYAIEAIEDELVRTAEYLMETGRAADAARVYELVSRRYPSNAAAREGMAAALASLEGAAGPVGARDGALYRELARVDRLLFTALFADCDAARANALLTDDVEFYDDRTGLSVGDDLRADFRRLAEACPADNGVRRMLVPGSVRVEPIEGWGALQTGVHRFVEEGASTETLARFHHLWKRVDGAWRLARIVSIHDVVDADATAPVGAVR